ncbi:bifunctional riboflavin kinase/FAD synthetase [Pedomonas sp. V897]|uniref:bifunctional riboflavin kinase/FAD synthetase n=1 Tax=Pedomonas sp. V897 TaxID=3446482 RepID=UPI003EE11CE1
MELITGQQPLPDHLAGGVAALGNFDGFHPGHQAVVRQASALAAERGGPLLVITFDPHPARFFRPDQPPFQLTSIAERARLMAAFGVDALVVLTFDPPLAALSPEDFFRQVLVERLRLKGVVSGYDFTFGKGRSGTTETLQRLADSHGMASAIVEPVCVEGDEAVSSTLIRSKLAEGDVTAAARLLGRWWGIEGTVEGGDQRGRTIGFPTANVSLGDYARPRYGVYAVRVTLPGGQVAEGVANIGIRPTFTPPRELLEVHLFDFSGDLYGADVRVELIEFIRPEMKFDGLDALRRQIGSDSASALKILRQPAYAPGRFKAPRSAARA